MIPRIRFVRTFVLIIAFILGCFLPATAQERLCDPAFEDCYTPILKAVQDETVGIDIAFYWIELDELANVIISRYQAGVPVRITVEPRASLKFPHNQMILDRLKAAGIPMRFKLGSGILHSKMLLLAGQNKVIFTSSNFGDGDVRPFVPFVNYVDGAWYFCDDPPVVNSFKTRYDDIWTNTIAYGDYANILSPLNRRYQTYAIDPSMNFLPNENSSEDYGVRTIALIDRESQRIDLTMYRISDISICDALLRAVARGIPVRLLAEPREYRFDSSAEGPELTGPYNIDRLYAAGVQIRMRKHQGLTHEKSVSLYGQRLTIFGSSNWSSPSFNFQEEHNYFTNKGWFFQWFVDQFNRKWNSATEFDSFVPLPPEAPVATEFDSFVPLPPEAPVNLSPANGSSVGQSVQLTWEGGRWAHKYDVYLGLDSDNLSLIGSDVITGTLGPGGSESFLLSRLQSGVNYCWRIVGKTMANKTTAGPTWCFTTSGTMPTPTPSDSMQLLLDSAGPAIDQLASLDSILLLRDPFPVIRAAEPLGQRSDQNTKLMVFVKNLQLMEGEPVYSVVVNLRDANNKTYDVLAESVRPVPNTDFVQVIFRLPNNLAVGTCTVRVKAHGQITNAGTMRIKI